ncbi:MFS transporter [Jatrophihabitans fulvus]
MTVAAPSGRRAATGAVLGVLFLTFLDTTIVSVTLGDIVADVGAGVIPLQWVVNAYALVFAALMLLGGAISDRVGRRRVMVAGVVAFAAGSLVCALAPSVGWIIAGRAVMGVGAAAAEPGTLSVIRQLYPDRRERSRALGAWSAVSGLALALGPVVGGVLVAAGGWRWVFWANLAAAAVLLPAVLRCVPESRDPRPGPVDAPGSVLAAGGLGLLIFGVISGEYRGWTTWWVLACLVGGAVLLVLFVPVERRARNPMLNIAYLRERVVSTALFAAFAVYFGVFAIFFFTALYLDIGLGYSGGRLALTFAPMAVAIVAGGLLSGRWVARAGSRRPTAVGCALAAAGMLLARSVVAGDPSSAVLATALAVAGLGFGITVVPLTSAVLTHVPARDSGMAASATNTARQLGAVVGVAALGAVVNHYLTSAVDRVDPLLVKLVGGREAAVRLLQTGGDIGGVDITEALRTTPQLQPFVDGFLDGLRWSLLVAAVLVVVAGIAVAAAREPDSGGEERVAAEP